MYNFGGGHTTLNVDQGVLETTAVNTGAGGGNYTHGNIALNVNPDGTLLMNGLYFWGGTVSLNGGLVSNPLNNTFQYMAAGNRDHTLNINSGLWWTAGGFSMGYDYDTNFILNLRQGALVSDGAASINVGSRRGEAFLNIYGGELRKVRSDTGGNPGAIQLCSNASGSNILGIVLMTNGTVRNEGLLDIPVNAAAGCWSTGMVRILGGTWTQATALSGLPNISLPRLDSPGQAYGLLEIAGPGVLYQEAGGIYLGRSNGVGQIVVRNGGRLESTAIGDGMQIGRSDVAAPCAVTVQDPDSYLQVSGWALVVGSRGWSNTMLIANGGQVQVSQRMYLGRHDNDASQGNTTSYDNVVLISNGVLNVDGPNPLNVQAGTLQMDGGTVTVNSLSYDTLFADPAVVSRVNFNAGVLKINDASSVNNHGVFYVGDGVHDARLLLMNGAGQHYFTQGLSIRANARLGGDYGQTFHGDTTIEPGGLLAPGTSIGSLTLANLTLNDGSIYDWETDGVSADECVCNGTLTIGNAVTVLVAAVSMLPGGVTGTLFTCASVPGTWNNLVLDLSGVPGASDGVIFTEGNAIKAAFLVPEPAGALALLALGALLRRTRCISNPNQTT
ncbi:MAG: hypothetical protein NTV22_08470 [bacterium]|nr:hypothetical protein [bacterium]